MTIESSGQISMGDTAGTNRSIFQEKVGFTQATVEAQNLSLRGFSVDGVADFQDESGDDVDKTGTPNSSAPYRMSEFHGYSFATPISITHYMRNNSSLDTVFLDDSQTAPIILGHNVTLEVYMLRADPVVTLYCRPATTGYDTMRWWNTSSIANNFTSSSSWVLMGRFNESGATAIKMDWSVSSSGNGGSTAVGNTSATGATYAAVDNTYQSVSNYQSIGATFTATSAAECYATNTRTMVVTLNAYMQKTGKQETPLGSYRLEMRSSATSNNCL